MAVYRMLECNISIFPGMRGGAKLINSVNVTSWWGGICPEGMGLWVGELNSEFCLILEQEYDDDDDVRTLHSDKKGKDKTDKGRDHKCVYGDITQHKTWCLT